MGGMGRERNGTEKGGERDMTGTCKGLNLVRGRAFRSLTRMGMVSKT